MKKWSKLFNLSGGGYFTLNIPARIFEKLDTSEYKAEILIIWCIVKIQNYINNGSNQLTTHELKELMGYSPVEKKINKVIKKHGLAVNTGMIQYEGNTRLIDYDKDSYFYKVSAKTLIKILTLQDTTGERIGNSKLAAIWLYINIQAQICKHPKPKPCKISNSVLCDIFGLSEPTVIKYIDILVRYNYISKISHKINNTKNTINEYTIKKGNNPYKLQNNT